jgi:hypothetical protein
MLDGCSLRDHKIVRFLTGVFPRSATSSSKEYISQLPLSNISSKISKSEIPLVTVSFALLIRDPSFTFSAKNLSPILLFAQNQVLNRIEPAGRSVPSKGFSH